MVLAQRTLDSLPQTGYDYRSNRTQPTVSDMRKWKAESIWDGLVSYYEASANLTPTLTENQKQAVICSIAEDSELLQSFAPAFTALTLSEQIFAKCLADAPQRKMINVIKMGRFVGKKDRCCRRRCSWSRYGADWRCGWRPDRGRERRPDAFVTDYLIHLDFK